MGETVILLWQTKTTQLKQLIMLLNNLHVDAQKLGYLRLYMAQLTEYDDTSSPDTAIRFNLISIAEKV